MRERLIGSAVVGCHQARCLEVELNAAHKAEQEQKAAEVLPQLQPAQEAADEATEVSNRLYSEYRRAEGAASRFSMYRSQAEKRLKALEAEYPGV